VPELNSPGLSGGINQGVPREQISSRQTPSQLNMTVVDGVVRKRYGYSANTGSGLTGSFYTHGYHYQDGVSGLLRFWAFTGAGAFYKTTLDGSWTDATDSQTVTSDIDYYWTTTTATAFDSLKTHLICCQADTNALGGTFVKLYHADNPEGTLRPMTGADSYCDNASGYHYCKKAISFEDHVFLLHTQEKYNEITNDMFQRVRWSDTASFLGIWSWDPDGVQPTVSVDETGGTGTDASPSVITKAGAFAGLTLNGESVYLEGTNCTTGYYTVASNTDNTITLTDNASSGGAMSALIIKMAYAAVGSTAGYQDLKSEYGSILTGERVGDALAIYLQYGIYIVYKTNSSTVPFQFDDIRSDMGLLSPRLVINTPVGNIFIGTDKNVHRLAGDGWPRAIGNEIKTELFADLHSGVDGNYKVQDRSFMIALKDIEAIAIVIPTGSGSETTKAPDTWYVYFWRLQRWEKWVPADTFMGYGEWRNPQDNDSILLPILGDDSGSAFEFDYVSLNDVSTAITSTIDTQDYLFNLKNKHTVSGVWFEAKADSAMSLTVEYSIDSGSTYVESQTVTLSSGWESYSITFATATAYVIRFRFRDATVSEKFYLGQIKAMTTQGEAVSNI